MKRETITKKLTICIVAMLFFSVMLVKGSAAYDEEKIERCTLQSVTFEVGGKTHTVTGGLEPIKVANDVDWEEYLSGLQISSCQVIENKACTSGCETYLRGYLKQGDSWINFAFIDMDRDDPSNNYISFLEDIDYNVEYMDVKYEFAYGVTEETPTGMYIRFAKAYDITYDLAGGSFATQQENSYAAGVEYTLPTPVKTGYDFAGWTGDGLTEPTKVVVIPADATGSRSYTATWTKAAPSTDNNVQNSKITVGKSIKLGKMKYKVIAAGSKKVEVSYSGATSKSLKKITIPATVKLSDGTVAKVTAIGAKAFANNKKLKTIIIGKNIKKIGKKAFYGCKNLKKITIKTTKLTKKNVGSSAFKNINKKATIKVPKKKVTAYKKLLKAKGIGKKVAVKKS